MLLSLQKEVMRFFDKEGNGEEVIVENKYARVTRYDMCKLKPGQQLNDEVSEKFSCKFLCWWHVGIVLNSMCLSSSIEIGYAMREMVGNWWKGVCLKVNR